MRLERRGASGFIASLALGLAACGGPARPGGAGQPGGAAAPQSATDPTYLEADGTVDYAALRATFGEPNQNVVLNPDAVDVAQTPSVGSVTNLRDRLVFDRAEAGWLLSHQPGDVLYCNHACGGSGFLRRIVSIAPQGQSVVVATVDGIITDVIRYGWLHLDADVDVDPSALGSRSPAPGSGTVVPPPGSGAPAPIGESGSGAKDGSEDKEADVDLSAHSGMRGSIRFGPKFVAHMTVDIAISWSRVDLVKFEVKGGPQLALVAQLVAQASADASQTFWKTSIPIGSFPISVVEVTVELGLTAQWHASADGKISATASATVGEQFDVGFVYTWKDGAQLIDAPPTPSWNDSLSATGEAGAKAGVALGAALNFKLYDLAGPSVKVTGDLGAEVNFEASASVSGGSSGTSTGCKAELNGDFYFRITGSVGLVVGVFGLQKDEYWDIASHEWTFPDPKWSYEIPGVSEACAAEDGGAPVPDGGGTPVPDGGGTPVPDGGAVLCQGSTFAAQVAYPVGRNPYSVAVGDFNGDGKPDLAVANHNDNTVGVLLNQDGGTFAAQVTYPVGVEPVSVAVGDFNGDGKPDLAVVNQNDNTVGVLLNQGNGTFAAQVPYPVGNWPFSVAVGDFNGDGRPDLAVAN
ncbi:MAG: FG-GAP repeat domain-containing protein, partial [Deltaproteobacteria bacterium]